MPEAPKVGDWLMAVSYEEDKEDYIDSLIPNGNDVSLLAGRPGTGKTNLCLYMALCLATGVPFFGFATQRVKVTYLGFEGSRIKMASRLDKIMREFKNPGDYFHFELVKPTSQDRLGSKFTEHIHGSQVVILDPLRYAVDGDFMRPQDASNFITKLKQIAISEELTFVLCHHIRKPQGYVRIEPDDLYQLKGATEYVDAATTVLLFEKTKLKPGPKTGNQEIESYTLYFAKTRDAINDIPPVKLHFNRDKLIYERLEK